MTPPERAETAKESDTRERILEAGSRAIAEKSFHACGLKEILDAAGVPKGSFYHYFPSKDDFGVAMVERAKEEDLARLGGILNDKTGTPLARLRNLYAEGRRQCEEGGASRQCFIAKLALEHAHLSPPLRTAVKNAYHEIGSLLAAVVREGQEAGEITKAHDTIRLASILMMLWEGATMRMQIEGGIEPVDEMIEFLFQPRFLFAPPARA